MKQITIVGYLGRNAEVKQLQSNKFLLIFDVAVSSKKTDKNTGEITSTTDWFNVSKSYNKKPENILSYLTKGRQTLVIGDISFQQFKAESGNVYFNKNVYAQTLNILFDKKEENDN